MDQTVTLPDEAHIPPEGIYTAVPMQIKHTAYSLQHHDERQSGVLLLLPPA